MHEEALPEASSDLLASLTACDGDELRGWVLAEGTGLALQLGHRISEDFDFFRTSDMDTASLFDRLQEAGTCEVLQYGERTLSVLLRGVLLSFFQIDAPFLFPTTPYRFFDVADLRDIALMKLLAVNNRGSRKDFVDLFAILQTAGAGSLSDYIDMLPRKYGPGRLNPNQVVMSLAYFDDAEAEPLPRMREPFDWERCKEFFVRQARSLVLP